MKSSWLILLMLSCCLSAQAQVSDERAFRIRKEQFPSQSLELVSPYLEGAKKLWFYKEIDSSRVRYKMKFRKDRLSYLADFGKQGDFGGIGVFIGPVDIPDESWEAITAQLQGSFRKHRVRSILQQYPRQAFPSDEETFRMAFQNLIIPRMRYELLVRGQMADSKSDYNCYFTQQGGLLKIREALPPNHDHVLY